MAACGSMNADPQEFAEALDLIGALETSASIQALVVHLGGSAPFEAALHQAIAQVRSFVSSVRSGPASMPALLEGLSALDAAAVQGTDEVLIAASRQGVRALGAP